MKDKVPIYEAIPDLLGVGFKFQDAKVEAMAGTTGSSAEDPQAAVIVNFMGDVPDMRWRVRRDGKGVCLCARSGKAVSVLQEMIAHLYQIAVEEKVDIETLYGYHEFKKSKEEGEKDYE